jgi:ferritin-like metal-binding protein YciE
MAQDREVLVAWLNDAYAMEKAQIPVLENHAKDAREFPSIRLRGEQHVEETRRHAELVGDCIERLGESPSATKSALGTMIGNVQSVTTGAFRDELVKNFLMDFAAENLEIASYNAIITAARDLGEDYVARTCEQILRDEQEMAGWLQENLPTAVRETLRA